MPCYYAHLLIQPPPPPPKVTRNASPFAGGNHTTQHERMASSTTRNAANGMPPSYEEGSQRGYEVGQVWRNIILQRCIEPMYIYHYQGNHAFSGLQLSPICTMVSLVLVCILYTTLLRDVVVIYNIIT